LVKSRLTLENIWVKRKMSLRSGIADCSFKLDSRLGLGWRDGQAICIFLKDKTLAR